MGYKRAATPTKFTQKSEYFQIKTNLANTHLLLEYTTTPTNNHSHFLRIYEHF